MLTDELAATKDNWSGSVKTKWGTISGSSKLADTKDNWSGSVKTKWGTISGSSKLADEAAAKDNWKLSGGFGGWGASVGVQSRLATKGNKDVSLNFNKPGGAKVGLEFCALQHTVEVPERLSNSPTVKRTASSGTLSAELDTALRVAASAVSLVTKRSETFLIL